MKMLLKKTTQSPPRVQQSRLKRDWMDKTYKKHAYQCMPMTVANVLGWEMVLENDVVVFWDGGNSVPRIISGGVSEHGRTVASCSIIGMISFHMGWVISTPENISCWLTGSPNYFVDGASPLTATIPTWWWPDEVQMNWMITKSNEEIVFPAGSPFCFFFAHDERINPSIDIELGDLFSDETLVQSRVRYNEDKMKRNQDQPWVWTKGIKTGVDSDGKQIGPTFSGLPKLSDPLNGNNSLNHLKIGE